MVLIIQSKYLPLDGREDQRPALSDQRIHKKHITAMVLIETRTPTSCTFDSPRPPARSSSTTALGNMPQFGYAKGIHRRH